jgi:hypothetical protein
MPLQLSFLVPRATVNRYFRWHRGAVSEAASDTGTESPETLAPTALRTGVVRAVPPRRKQTISTVCVFDSFDFCFNEKAECAIGKPRICKYQTFIE